ncbi:MAG TPA: lysophospholipid acyltransferase family protein [Candidatus Sulfotelmatobacter sp.]|nr:lysophospholipid acyltransferase family protein [Candidatus Sulfotelmatobacter sp.]
MSSSAVRPHSRALRPSVAGFPSRFPVRDDDLPSVRYRISVRTLRIFMPLIFGRHAISIEGEENIPDDGPLLVVSNHLSNLDPLLFGTYFPKTLFALTKRELFRTRALTWFWAGCNLFPIDRSVPDRWALKTALDVLHSGGRLLMFAEGTRAPRPGMRRAEPGIGFLLRRAPGTLVLPAGLWGTEAAMRRGDRLLHRAPMHLRYGEPFSPPLAERRRGGDQEIADAIGGRIAALLPEAYRGVYGGSR